MRLNLLALSVIVCVSYCGAAQMKDKQSVGSVREERTDGNQKPRNKCENQNLV